MTRAVVTGLGCVTPIGEGVHERRVIDMARFAQTGARPGGGRPA